MSLYEAIMKMLAEYPGLSITIENTGKETSPDIQIKASLMGIDRMASTGVDKVDEGDVIFTLAFAVKNVCD